MEMRIGGKEVSSPDDAWIEVKNPATGELIDRVPAGSVSDVAEAVDAADAAFESWKKKGMRERGMILFHAAGKVRDVRPGMWVLGFLSLLFYLFYPY